MDGIARAGVLTSDATFSMGKMCARTSAYCSASTSQGVRYPPQGSRGTFWRRERAPTQAIDTSHISARKRYAEIRLNLSRLSNLDKFTDTQDVWVRRQGVTCRSGAAGSDATAITVETELREALKSVTQELGRLESAIAAMGYAEGGEKEKKKRKQERKAPKKKKCRGKKKKGDSSSSSSSSPPSPTAAFCMKKGLMSWSRSGQSAWLSAASALITSSSCSSYAILRRSTGISWGRNPFRIGA
mmetsp:Transcript_39445/g.85859  ORF Transcript_39445/g.85859 Transcript_39445/m.85859 type:complete len:243 (+) Transcript_39445:64-792(+)